MNEKKYNLMHEVNEIKKEKEKYQWLVASEKINNNLKNETYLKLKELEQLHKEKLNELEKYEKEVK